MSWPCIAQIPAAMHGLMQGLQPHSSLQNIQPAQQDAVYVTATQTKYLFSCGAINLEVDFLSPLLADNLDMLSRPVSFIRFSVTAKDNGIHDVNILFAESCCCCRQYR